MARKMIVRSIILILLGMLLLVGPHPSRATQVESGGGALPGYVDFSYDSNTVLLSTTGTYDQTVFLDTIYPFDQTLRYKHSEPLVRYQLDHKTFKKQNVLMVALADLKKIYAPYFKYEVIGDEVTVTHRFYRKQVTAGATTRTPTLRYTKVEWEAIFSLKSRSGLVRTTTYQPYETNRTGSSLSAALDNAQVDLTSGPYFVTLETTPSVHNHLVYVPVASFMHALGKTATEETGKNHKGYLAISSISPDDKTNDLFNPAYDGLEGFPYTPITASRVAYMDGVLNGTISKGNFWNGFYMGDVTVFTGNYDENGNDITAVQSINRILPYRLYIPRSYDPALASKFSFVLHGSTGNENAPLERPNDHLTNQSTPIPGVITVEDYADHYNYILLSPNGWTRGPVWGRGPGEVSLLTAFEIAKAQYNIDPSKVVITGNSAGGSGAMNFAARHTAMFKAMAPTAPAGSAALTGPIVDLPTHYICYAQDVTVAYAGNCIPQYNAGPKKALRDVTIQTIEEGHHSYGQASAQQVIFEFFDDVLAGASNNDVQTVHFTTGVAVAEVTDSAGQKTQVPLATVPVQKDDQLMVGLADLAKIYGRTFHAYDVYAYNTDPNNVVRVIAVKYNHVMVNIKKDDTFLRVGGTIRVGDTRSGTTKVQPGDPDIDPRTDLSVAPYGVGADVVVPVVEFMNLFGKTAIAD